MNRDRAEVPPGPQPCSQCTTGPGVNTRAAMLAIHVAVCVSVCVCVWVCVCVCELSLGLCIGSQHYNNNEKHLTQTSVQLSYGMCSCV